IAEPMTVGTMAWMLLRRYMPREGIAKTLATDIGRAYKEALMTNAQTQGNRTRGAQEKHAQAQAAKKGIEAMCGGAAPGSEAANRELAEVCFRAATGTILSVLQDE